MHPLLAPIFKLLLAVSQPDSSHLTVENCDFGEVYAFAIVECQFEFKNAGTKSVRVFDIGSNVSADSFDLHELVLAPRSSQYLAVKISIENASGFTRHIFKFRTDETGAQQLQVTAYGFALTTLDQSQPELDFGIVDLQKEMMEKTIRLDSHNVAEFRIVKILDKPPWIDASISSDGRSVLARIRPDAPWGPYAEFIKLEINTPEQAQAWVSVKADIRGEVVPAFNPFVVGVIRLDDNNEYRIPLKSRSGKAFSIGKIRLENIVGEALDHSCEPATPDCRWVVLTFSKNQPIGTIKGSMFIDLPELRHSVKISVRGVLLDKDAKVKTLDPSQLESENAKSSTFPQTRFELNDAIKNAVDKAQQTAPTGTGPLLEWTVANGRSIHGFQIFRTDKELGPFLLLNRATMPANIEDDSPRSFQYRDNTAESGKTYWYYIGLVYNDGHKQPLTDAQKVVAK